MENIFRWDYVFYLIREKTLIYRTPGSALYPAHCFFTLNWKKRLFFDFQYGKMKLRHIRILMIDEYVCPYRGAFCFLAKMHSPVSCILIGARNRMCRSIGALHFSCVASIEAAHFLFYKIKINKNGGIKNGERLKLSTLPKM